MQSQSLTPDMLATARTIGEVLIAMRKGKATADDYRAAMRASREQWGADVHELVKARALAGATGGRA